MILVVIVCKIKRNRSDFVVAFPESQDKTKERRNRCFKQILWIDFGGYTRLSGWWGCGDVGLSHAFQTHAFDIKMYVNDKI